jgi:hypothetical protein
MRRIFSAPLVAALLVTSSSAFASVLADPKGTLSIDLAPLEGHACTVFALGPTGLPTCANRPPDIDKRVADEIERGSKDHVVGMFQITRGSLVVGAASVILVHDAAPHDLNDAQAHEAESGIVQGMIARVAPGAKVNHHLEIEHVNGVQVLKVVGDLDPPRDTASSHQILHAFMTSSGHYLLSFTSAPSEVADVDALATAVAATAHATPAGPATTAAYRAGYLAGRITFVVACLAGLAFAARSIKRNRGGGAPARDAAPPAS